MNEKYVQIIPSLPNMLYPYKADLKALETIIKSDSENKIPLIVFARAGIRIIIVCHIHYYHTFYIKVLF